MSHPIMIQGTMSNAGKSLLAAGLCRIFRQDGYSVAPFKSQNMALNSYITDEGLEMGRAQVMQAEAAGIRPEAAMNPILLKPTNDTGSQVIVNGEVLGNMSARDYFAYKKKLVPQIMEAYRSLASRFDIIVIEGAGSPAEINLKQDDIVNMGMARLAKAPVLLVGDIDRGGVFAQLIGTVMLLDPDEQSMIRGTIINKFRGDKSILDPGLAMLEERTGIPVVGVTPWMEVDLDDEDSLASRLSGSGPAEAIDIAVIRFPRISNFTDFHILESTSGVSVRYVSSVRELGSPDLILLPGTKNTMADLLWLRQCGLEAAIAKAHAHGSLLFGICGGYQMLGETLDDPEGVEQGGCIAGLGYLPMHTTFTAQKTRTRVTGNLAGLPGALAPMSGCVIEGYEIHMGITTADRKVQPLAHIRDRVTGTGEIKVDGACLAEGIYGTYIHGFFDRQETASALIGALAEYKGIDAEHLPVMDYAAYKERQYDLLADTLRRHLDMEKIYEILEAGLE